MKCSHLSQIENRFHQIRARVKNVAATVRQHEADHLEGQLLNSDTSNGHIISVQAGSNILYIAFPWKDGSLLIKLSSRHRGAGGRGGVQSGMWRSEYDFKSLGGRLA